jgi:hypothetical protein
VEFHKRWAKKYLKIKLVTDEMDEILKVFYISSLDYRFDSQYKFGRIVVDDNQIKKYIYVDFVIKLCKNENSLLLGIEHFKQFSLKYIKEREPNNKDEIKLIDQIA